MNFINYMLLNIRVKYMRCYNASELSIKSHIGYGSFINQNSVMIQTDTIEKYV